MIYPFAKLSQFGEAHKHTLRINGVCVWGGEDMIILFLRNAKKDNWM